MIRNNIKKLISINFIIIFILSIINLSQISLASDVNKITQGNINVSNIENGVKVTLYKIATIEVDESQNVPKDEYKWAEQVSKWIETNEPEYLTPEDFYNKLKDDPNNVTDIYEKIIMAVNKGEIELSPFVEKTSEGEASYPVTDDNLNGNVRFENVDIGTYIVMIENGYMIYNPSTVNVIPKYNSETNSWNVENANVTIKASIPSIIKWVIDDDKKVDNYGTNDTICYTIKADVPKYSENTKRTSVIKIETDKSITLKRRDFSVWAYKEKDDTEGTLITNFLLQYAGERDGKNCYGVVLHYGQFKDYKMVEIKYNTVLAKDDNLVIGKGGNNTYVYFSYANNPYSSTDEIRFSAGKTTVYTYKMNVKSVDRDDNNISLAGSRFNILDENGQKLYLVKQNDGEYILATETTSNATDEAEVDESGNLVLKGLDAKEYKLKQVKAPDGYVINTKPYSMSLNDSDLDGELDEEYTLIFPNSKGFELPLTGGQGVITFVILGLVLIVMGIILIISINKKRKILKNK